MPLVNLPDGTQASFPDDMPHDQIVSVIQKHLQKGTEQAPTPVMDSKTTVPTTSTSAPQATVASQVTASDSNAMSIGKAAVAGLSNGGADIAQGLGDTPTFVLKSLHLISPETANKLYAQTKTNTDMFRASANGDQSDSFNQAVNQHPLVAAGAKTATDIAGIAAGNRMISPMGVIAADAAPVAKSIAGLVGRMTGAGLVTQGGTDPDNKAAAFTLGSLTQPVADAGSLVLGKLGSKANTIDSIKDTMGATRSDSLQSTILNKVFSDLNGNEGTFNFNSAAKQLQKEIKALPPTSAMSPVIDTLRGIQKASAEIARGYKLSGLAIHAAGASTGAAAGYQEGGEEGAVAGGIIGGIGAGYAAHALKDMINSPTGMATLGALGKPGTTTAEISHFVKALVLGGVAKALNNHQTPEDNQ